MEYTDNGRSIFEALENLKAEEKAAAKSIAEARDEVKDEAFWASMPAMFAEKPNRNGTVVTKEMLTKSINEAIGEYTGRNLFDDAKRVQPLTAGKSLNDIMQVGHMHVGVGTGVNAPTSYGTYANATNAQKTSNYASWSNVTGPKYNPYTHPPKPIKEWMEPSEYIRLLMENPLVLKAEVLFDDRPEEISIRVMHIQNMHTFADDVLQESMNELNEVTEYKRIKGAKRIVLSFVTKEVIEDELPGEVEGP